MGMIGESLRIVQLGKQTQFDTAVTPTAILMGVDDASIKIENTSQVLKQLRGNLYPGTKAVLSEVGGSGKIDLQGSYEDILYLVESLLGVATPSGTYIRDYVAPGAAAVASPRMLTMVLGYAGATEPYKLTGGHVSKLTIKADSGGDPIMASAELVGYDVSSATLASLSERAVNPIMGHQTQIYMDAAGGTIGTTEIVNLAYSYELEIDGARAPGRRLSLRPSTIDETRWGGTLKLGMMVSGATETILTAIAEQTDAEERQVRILHTDGTRIFRIDFAGVFTEAPEIYNITDDLLSLEFTLEGKYNTALGNWLKVHSENGVSAIP